ncbi:MAG: hypothetical protein Q7T44_00090 [Parvibaculum sp.]|nr:hypothetical protein [Parvibaculum sp.]
MGVLFSSGILQASGIVYSAIATTGAAGAYLLLLRLLTATSQLSQAPFYSALPRLTRLQAAGDHSGFVRLAAQRLSASLCLYALGSGIILLALPYVLQFLHSSISFPPAAISGTMVLAFFAERYGSMHIQLYSLTRPILWHRINGASAVIAMASTAISYQFLGAASIALGFLIAFLGFYAPCTSILSFRALDIPRWDFDRKTLAVPTSALVVVVILSAFAHRS